MDSIEYYLDLVLTDPKDSASLQPLGIIPETAPVKPKQKKFDPIPVNLPGHKADRYTPSILPQLTKPSDLSQKKNCIELTLILMNNKIYDVSKGYILSEEMDIQKSNNRLRELHKDYLNILSKQVIESQKSDSWKELQKIATYVFSGALMIFGAYLAAESGSPEVVAAGKMIMVSAGLGLFTQAMQDTNGFDELAKYLVSNDRTQKMVSTSLETSFVLLSLGVGLYSGFGGLTKIGGISALGHLPRNLQHVQHALATGSVATTAFSQLQQQYAVKTLRDYETRVKELEIDKTKEENKMSTQGNLLDESLASHDAIFNIVKKAVDQYGFYT